MAPNARFLWKTPPSPSISVGNLAMGGRGKTPVVAYIARLLVEAGERPAILSRGYGRRVAEDGVVIVSDGVDIRADLDRAGDEPLLLARSVPGAVVLVCDQRAIARALAAAVLDVTVHLFDDGFQHRAATRDVDIVLVSAADLADRRVPFGRLREPVSALRRAHALVVDGQAGDDEVRRARAAGLPAAAPVFSLHRALGEPQPLEPERPWPAARAPVVAIAGIAGPERFTRALEAAGWTVARTLAFGDHHRYGARDLAQIARAVADTGAVAALTTAKDAVRLMPLRPLPVPVAFVPLHVAIEPADAFRVWLFDRLNEARA